MISFRQPVNTDFDKVYHLINLLENDVFDREVQVRLFEKNLANPDIIYLLAFVEGEVAGFISCHAQWLLHHASLIGEIQEMVVVEKFRSQGIGKKLLHQLEVIAREKGIRQLEVTSNKKRVNAHRFYLREGFGETHLKFTREL